MEMWTSNEKLRSIDCSFLAAYIDYDGKPCKILHLHPQSSLWIDSESEHFDGSMVACGHALLGSDYQSNGIPDWFNPRSTNSFGTIQIHTDLDLEFDLDEWKGYASFIVYQFHESETYPSKKRQ
ncbi:hypothetical protein FH972_010024 [Carpinus fangiana]|uniref:Uncharacterized protein n=1 Tax=Carpinus fangiana TaxID=176857 RepID=A0A660KM06_9ROSI|nr:hypothetical protein FH972_010024 [Carpinus fangiana]